MIDPNTVRLGVVGGGETRFLRETGFLILAYPNQSAIGPTIPTTGISQVSSTISVLPTQIPETKTTAALVGMGLIMTAFMLYRQQKIFE